MALFSDVLLTFGVFATNFLAFQTNTLPEGSKFESNMGQWIFQNFPSARKLIFIVNSFSEGFISEFCSIQKPNKDLTLLSPTKIWSCSIDKYTCSTVKAISAKNCIMGNLKLWTCSLCDCFYRQRNRPFVYYVNGDSSHVSNWAIRNNFGSRRSAVQLLYFSLWGHIAAPMMQLGRWITVFCSRFLFI